MLKALWRTMGGFGEILQPWHDASERFEKDVKPGIGPKICTISSHGGGVKEGSDLIQDVTVTWLDGVQETWKLRLSQLADGTPIIENGKKQATFTEVVQTVASDRAKSGGKGINGGLGMPPNTPTLVAMQGLLVSLSSG